MSEAAAVPDSVEGVVEAAGHFRVYLGAAAGVGKTYAMLNEGHRRQARGSGVVVGFVESHGRQLTEKLVEGLEVVPRQVVDYRGSRLQEMDLDAVLRRHPKIALIDELAHTNVPGSGRRTRWQQLSSGGSNVMRIIREAGAFGIDVHVIARRELPAAAPSEATAASETIAGD